MSISPTTPSTSFSFYPEVDFEEAQVVLPNTENEQDQVEPSRQPIPLKERICALVDRMGYRFYAGVIDLPHIMPRESVHRLHVRKRKDKYLQKNLSLLQRSSKGFWLIQRVFIPGLGGIN